MAAAERLVKEKRKRLAREGPLSTAKGRALLPQGGRGKVLPFTAKPLAGKSSSFSLRVYSWPFVGNGLGSGI
jgi:hypothetical protein